MTPAQDAAAMHGLATNKSLPVADRLLAALQALGWYEADREARHSTTLSPEYEDFLLRFVKHFNKRPDYQWVMKITEEAGEVTEAFIGWEGSNTRKGVTHSARDVADEMGDVVMCALVAIVRLGFDPKDVLTRQREKTEGYFPDAFA